MAPKKAGTRENPSSPLHPGVPDPEKILRDARQQLSSTSSGRFMYPSALEIPDPSQFVSHSTDPQAKKGKEEQNLSFPVTKIEKFQVFTNPLLSEEVKDESLHTRGFPQCSPYIALTSRVPLHQLKFRNYPSLSNKSS